MTTAIEIIRIKGFSTLGVFCSWLHGRDQLGTKIDENGVFAIGITPEQAEELLAPLRKKFTGSLEVEVIKAKLSKAAA